MPDICLFHMPGACSGVAMIALEEAGLEYEDRVINIFAGEQRSASYLSVNPKGKVPALRFDGCVITEGAAILIFIDEQYPEGRLLPSGNAAQKAQYRSDLIWCSNTLHPLARSIMMPDRIAPGAPESARAVAIEQLRDILASSSGRFPEWWNGRDWSITDAYVAWCLGLAVLGGFDLASFPEVQSYLERAGRRDSAMRARSRERAGLADAGIRLPPGFSL